jgi:hypothetical protein
MERRESMKALVYNGPGQRSSDAMVDPTIEAETDAIVNIDSATTLHLEKLRIRGLTITTGLVDTSTTPRLLELIADGRLDPAPSLRIISSCPKRDRRMTPSPTPHRERAQGRVERTSAAGDSRHGL